VLRTLCSYLKTHHALHSATDALNDPAKRRDIVTSVRAPNQTLNVFMREPKGKGRYAYVSKAVGVNEGLVEGP
jgi:hypothetical protein